MKRRQWLQAGGVAAALAAPLARGQSTERSTGSPNSAPDGDRIVAPGDTVRTSAGLVRGYRLGPVQVFKGIPYAGAATGALRFRRAPALKPWSGVRNALSYGPICPRWAPAADLASNEWAFLLQRGAESAALEDCLRLNIWTRGGGSGAKLPVMLWIHGQGFMSGSSQDFLATDGENLASAQDVVVVSLNHRVGPLGYLHLGGLLGEGFADSGNVGMQDIVDALRWLRENIAAFGGDADNITLFGQSGGGFKISVLLAMPEAQGLFHKAIIQSGARLRVHNVESATALTRATLKKLELSDAQALALQDIPVDRLLQAVQDATLELARSAADDPGFRSAPAYFWMPVSGVPSLPKQPFDPEAPAVSRGVPLLVGCTLNEFAPSVNAPEAEQLSWADVQMRLQPQLGESTAAAMAAARSLYVGARPVDIWSVLAGRRFRLSTVALCDSRLRQGGAPVFNYLFQWRTAVLEGRPGAFHTADLPFVFDNTDLCALFTGGGARARRLGARMSKAWAQFARSGSPAHAGLPDWPACSPGQLETMLLDDACELRRNHDRELLALLPGRGPTKA